MAGDGGETAIIYLNFRGGGEVARRTEVKFQIKNIGELF